MGTKYSSNSASGFDSVPPSDDGTVSEANKVKWSTIKTKLATPVKDLADAINTDLVTHFDHGPTALTSNTTLGASHYEQFIQVSGASVTLTLSDAATLTAGWNCRIVNTDSTNNITIGRATAGDTINGSAANFTLPALHAIDVFVIAAANGFLVRSAVINPVTTDTAQSFTAAKNFAEGSDVASAATTDIWSTTGNTVHVTGTTTITSLGTAPQAGATRTVIFDGALTLTHGANLNLPGAGNIVTAAGDMMEVYADTTTQHDVLWYTKASAFPLHGSQLFTASGTFTPVISGNHLVIAMGVGGGGGGGGGVTGSTTGSGNGGEAGSQGEFATTITSLTAGTGVTVTIPTAGTGGAGGAGGDGSVGVSGTNTTFGAVLTARGGTAGQGGIGNYLTTTSRGTPGGSGNGAAGGGARNLSARATGANGTAGQANTGQGGGGGAGGTNDGTAGDVSGGTGANGAAGFVLVIW